MLQLSVQFGTGTITGPQAVDTFHIGPFSVYNQTFAMIEKEDGNVWYDVPFEGIVGMAMDAMSANHVKPFFSSMIEQKALKHNEFAFYFSHDQPSANALFWGGVDKEFYDGKLQYFPVVDPYYWSLKLLGFKIGSNAILDPSTDTYEGTRNTVRKWKGPVAVVDTGTTFFTAESQKFHDVMEKLPPAECNALTEESHPPITITLENGNGEPSDFVMTNKQYMSQSGSRCSPAFMQIDLPEEHGPGMVLGEIFLRHFLGVFDRGSGSDSDARVAFAKSSSKPAAIKRLHELTADQPAFSTNRTSDAGSKLDNVK
jgi:pepsin A